MAGRFLTRSMYSFIFCQRETLDFLGGGPVEHGEKISIRDGVAQGKQMTLVLEPMIDHLELRSERVLAEGADFFCAAGTNESALEEGGEVFVNLRRDEVERPLAARTRSSSMPA